jgi:hypothetical protein
MIRDMLMPALREIARNILMKRFYRQGTKVAKQRKVSGANGVWLVIRKSTIS